MNFVINPFPFRRMLTLLMGGADAPPAAMAASPGRQSAHTQTRQCTCATRSIVFHAAHQEQGGHPS